MLQVEVCDHWHSGGRCEASTPNVVVAAHPTPPADGETLQRALQVQNYQQETQRGAAQGAGGGTRLDRRFGGGGVLSESCQVLLLFYRTSLHADFTVKLRPAAHCKHLCSVLN